MAVEIAALRRRWHVACTSVRRNRRDRERAVGRGRSPRDELRCPVGRYPLIRSGATFTHLVFVQNGTVVPWQYPHSELTAPFLIGEHEFLAGAQRWVGSYSAVTETIVVGIPVSVMAAIVKRVPTSGTGCTSS